MFQVIKQLLLPGKNNLHGKKTPKFLKLLFHDGSQSLLLIGRMLQEAKHSTTEIKLSIKAGIKKA